MQRASAANRRQWRRLRQRLTTDQIDALLGVLEVFCEVDEDEEDEADSVQHPDLSGEEDEEDLDVEAAQAEAWTLLEEELGNDRIEAILNLVDALSGEPDREDGNVIRFPG